MKITDARAQPSILDRLIDDQPEKSEEGYVSSAQTMRDFKAAVRRDLEWLLNTRCTIDNLGEDYETLEASVYKYGLPDFTSYGIGAAQTRQRLLRGIRNAVCAYEPRIMDVQVTAVEGEKNERQLQFLISGLLRVDPLPEQVTFDTRFDANKGEYKVREG